MTGYELESAGAEDGVTHNGGSSRFNQLKKKLDRYSLVFWNVSVIFRRL